MGVFFLKMTAQQLESMSCGYVLLCQLGCFPVEFIVEGASVRLPGDSVGVTVVAMPSPASQIGK
jgi:hypothetical protein